MDNFKKKYSKKIHLRKYAADKAPSYRAGNQIFTHYGYVISRASHPRDAHYNKWTKRYFPTFVNNIFIILDENWHGRVLRKFINDILKETEFTVSKMFFWLQYKYR